MKRLWLLASCFVLLFTARGVSRAQEPAPAAKLYTNKLQFRLPFKLAEQDRSKLREVQLYVKYGSEPWTCRETASPRQTSFTYRAARDGEYWFGIVAVDAAGNATPADLSRETPNLIVVVDTQRPDLDISSLAGSEAGEACFRCNVRDANLDPASIRLEYQGSDKTWHSLPALPDAPDVFRLSNEQQKGWTGVLRAAAADRAGNAATREINTRPPSPIFAPAPAVVDNGPGTNPLVSRSGKVAPPFARTPPPEPAVATAPNRQIINSTQAVLEYKIDQPAGGGASKVEVYMTRDQGQTWQFLCDDPDRQSPVEIKLPGEGVYGLALMVAGDTSRGQTPPAKGSSPDWWIEVDTTRPAAQLLTAQPAVGPEGGAVTIAWLASDKNLAPAPIDLYYASHSDGPWQPIAKGVRNDGTYRWSVPPNAGAEFFVRLDVRDQAGNVARCQTPQAVVMDSTSPRRARVIGMSAIQPRPTAPLGN